MLHLAKSFAFVLSVSIVCALLVPMESANAKKRDAKYINKLGSAVLATVGNEKITYGELERAFRKNMNRGNTQLWEVERDSVEDFLELYVNYRLKVQDALDRKVHEDPEVQTEIIRNRNAIAVPTFFEKNIMDPEVDKMWERRAVELRLRVILVGLMQTENPDTTEAFQKATEALQELKGGADFAKVAAQYSDDELSRESGGLIPFATSGQILRELEEAMYTLKPGELYPELITTRSGYFILKLEEEQPLKLVKASHILIMENSQRTREEAMVVVDSLLTELKRGAKFELLVAQNTEDNNSAVGGGALPGGYYSRSMGFVDGEGRLTPEFEEAMFKLKDGEISQAVATAYGVHIIRRDSSVLYQDYAKRKDVETRYKGLYFEGDKENLRKELRAKFGYKMRDVVMGEFLKQLDSTRTSNATDWDANVSDAVRNKVLYEMGDDGRMLVRGLIDSLKTRNDLRTTRLNHAGINRALQTLTNEKMMQRATDGMEERYPDFGALMREFRDGILIFRVENEKVWSRLTFDSTRAREYWENNKSKYKTDTLYDLSEIYVFGDSTAQKLHKQLEAGAQFEDLAAAHTMRQGFREKNGHLGQVTRAAGNLASRVITENLKPGEYTKPFRREQGYAIVRFNGIEKPRQKTFDEALPEFAAAVQDQMQKEYIEEWLTELREKHPVKVDNDVIAGIWEED